MAYFTALLPTGANPNIHIMFHSVGVNRGLLFYIYIGRGVSNPVRGSLLRDFLQWLRDTRTNAPPCLFALLSFRTVFFSQYNAALERYKLRSAPKNCLKLFIYKNISRTSAVSSTNFGSIPIFASCVVGTCNILCG